MADEPAVGCTIGDVVLDAMRGELRIPGADPVSLSPMEAEFLLYLARRHGQVIRKDELLQEVWRYSASVKSRAVDATLIRVRAKLEGTSIRIESVHGRGLQLLADTTPTFDAVPDGPELAPEPDEPLLGRAADLARLEAAFAARTRIIQLLGPAGMGKTALASLWARRAAGRRVDLQGIASPVALRRSVAASLGIEGDDVDTRIAAALAGGPPTVIDHAEGLNDEAEALLARWLATGTAPVLVGSQRRMKLAGEVAILSQLEREPALQLVREARLRSGLEPLPDEALDALWSSLGGHPLALRIAAPLFEWMRDTSDILELEAGSEPLSLLSAVTTSLAHLSDAAIDVVHALASFASPPATSSVLAVVGQPPARVVAALGELRQSGLVSAVDGTSSVLPAVRTVLRNAEAYREARDASDRRHVAWLLSLRPTHADLGPLRRELEWALHLVPPAERLPLLTRHLLMLYAYGPSEDVVPEADRWTADLPVDRFADGQELQAWARFSLGDRHGAEPILVGCIDHIADPVLRARGTALLSMLHAWWEEPDAAALADRALRDLPDDAPPFLRLDTLTMLGGTWMFVDPPRGRATLEQVVVEAGAAYPVRGLNAALSILRGHVGTPWELDRARWLMGRAQATLSAAHSAVLNADLAIVLLGAGERHEAWERLGALRARHREHPTPLGNSLLMDAAMRLVLVPDLATEILRDIDPAFSPDFACIVRSIAAGVPSPDLPPELEPFYAAMIAGDPLPEPTTHRSGWVRARFEVARLVADADA
ncbi:MAG: winged helix-turn-helix domain-containing protein [Alphaproteobacteria bacterium]|nr:winged helix-turn-helix domain-containing protein [Alphaproteobacteria bacterium]